MISFYLQKQCNNLLYEWIFSAEAFSSWLYSQITVVTSQPGQGVVSQLEMGLKDADLVSLKRLHVVQIYREADWGEDNPSTEATPTEIEGRKYS